MGIPIIMGDRPLEFALQSLKLLFVPELRAFGIGTRHRLIGKTIGRSPGLADKILRLRNIGPESRTHQSIQRRASGLRLLRAGELAPHKKNPGERRR